MLANENALLCPTTFGQLSIAEYLRTYDWYQQVKEYREMYHERGQAMQRALHAHLPMCTWNEPEGGFRHLGEAARMGSMLTRCFPAR